MSLLAFVIVLCCGGNLLLAFAAAFFFGGNIPLGLLFLALALCTAK